jgi:hypothetical protein
LKPQKPSCDRAPGAGRLSQASEDASPSEDCASESPRSQRLLSRAQSARSLHTVEVVTNQKVYEAEVIEPDERLPQDLVALRKFAWLLDSAFEIPGTKRRVGIDAGIGLIPWVGDIIGGALSTWVVVGAIRHRVPFRVLIRMLSNILFDVGMGLVPVVGDVGDIFFKPSMKNVDLLMKHRDRRRTPRSGTELFIFAAVLLGFFAVIALSLIAVVIAAIVWIVNAMMGR